jgi:hypothetical protein
MKNQAAFANDNLVVRFKRFFKLRDIINENAVDAALNFAARFETVNNLDTRVFGDDVRVPARNAAVVENDVVVFRPPDVINFAGKQVNFPAFAAGICDF